MARHDMRCPVPEEALNASDSPPQRWELSQLQLTAGLVQASMWT